MKNKLVASFIKINSDCVQVTYQDGDTEVVKNKELQNFTEQPTKMCFIVPEINE